MLLTFSKASGNYMYVGGWFTLWCILKHHLGQKDICFMLPGKPDMVNTTASISGTT